MNLHSNSFTKHESIVNDNNDNSNNNSNAINNVSQTKQQQMKTERIMIGGASFLKKNQGFVQNNNNTNTNSSSNNNNNASKVIENSHNNHNNNNVSNSINYYLHNQWLNSFSSSNTSSSSNINNQHNHNHNIMTLTSPNQNIPPTTTTTTPNKPSQIYFKNINTTLPIPKQPSKRYPNPSTIPSSSINSESKLEKLSIHEISQQLPQIARKQIGCRFLQKLLTQPTTPNTPPNSFANDYFFPNLPPHKIIDLSKDFFANYFIQKLIQHLNLQNLTSITSILLSDFLNLSTNPHGTRVIQKLNQIISPHSTLLNQFTNTFSKHIHQLFNDQHGTFILINYVYNVSFPENNFVFSFLSQSIKEAATSSYSCCTLQKCVDIANPQQQETLLINIAEHTHELITNQYGNYVLQFVLSKRNTSVNEVIVDNILKKIIDYAKQKYSSNVIEKCFEYCEHGLRCKIVNAIKTYESIVTLLFDMYGNYVLQKAITYADDEQSKSYFIGIIIKEINKLQEFEFGQKLITKLILTFPELRHAIKKNHKVFNVNIVAICNQIESLTTTGTMDTTMNNMNNMNMNISNNEKFNINMMMNNYNSINNGYI